VARDEGTPVAGGPKAGETDEASTRLAQRGALLLHDLNLTPSDCAAGLERAHEKYTQLYLSDNNRIWSTAAIMVPLSLGAFVVLASMDKPTIVQVIVLALASWLLMAVWFIIADNHRAFQEVSLERTRQIEELWGMRRQPRNKEKGRGLFGFIGLVGPGGVRRMRKWLLWLVAIGWLAVLLWWPSTNLAARIMDLIRPS
jgi:hypothetical protein